MYKYFLGFDTQELKHSFSYVTRDAMVAYFKSNNISYTFDIDEEYEEAILPSGTDLFSCYAKLKKKDVKINIIAASSISDFMVKSFVNIPIFSLSLDAINYYRKANNLLVYLDSQKQFISKFKIDTPISKFPLMHNDFDIKLESQKNAFLNNYAIQPGKEIIASYGIITNKERVLDLRAIARNIPEKEFFFFGKIAPHALKLTTFESITQPENLHFVEYLPEELYPSFLLNCSRLLLVSDYLAFPQILIDCIYHKIPLISYKVSGYEELINDKCINYTMLYSSLYDILNKEPDLEKIELAYNTLMKYKQIVE